MPFVRLLGQPRPHLPDQDGLRLLARLRSAERVRRLPAPGVLRRLDLDALANDYFFENDMLVHLNILECRVADVPMPARYGGARSSMRIGRVIAGFPRRLFGRFWKRIYQRYVLRDFSPVALFLLARDPAAARRHRLRRLGLVRVVPDRGSSSSTGRVMLSVLPIVIGFQLILQAILLDIQSSPK